MVQHSHEGLIRARADQLGQPKISTTEAERVIIKESKSSQAGTTQNPEKFEQASYGYRGYHNETERFWTAIQILDWANED